MKPALDCGLCKNDAIVEKSLPDCCFCVNHALTFVTTKKESKTQR